MTLTMCPPAVVKSGFLAELAVRNKLLGHGNVFTYGMKKSTLRTQLRGARRLDLQLDPHLTTTYDPGAPFDPYVGTVPSYLYGRILSPPAGIPERLIATVNGRPVAVGYSVDAGTKFTILIPALGLPPGREPLRALRASVAGR